MPPLATFSIAELFFSYSIKLNSSYDIFLLWSILMSVCSQEPIVLFHIKKIYIFNLFKFSWENMRHILHCWKQSFSKVYLLYESIGTVKYKSIQTPTSVWQLVTGNIKEFMHPHQHYYCYNTKSLCHYIYNEYNIQCLVYYIPNIQVFRIYIYHHE